MTLERLHALGFDLSAHIFGLRNRFAVRCSQCQASVINGVACHETGCPNAKHECIECGALIPVNQRYCEDCQ